MYFLVTSRTSSLFSGRLVTQRVYDQHSGYSGPTSTLVRHIYPDQMDSYPSDAFNICPLLLLKSKLNPISPEHQGPNNYVRVRVSVSESPKPKVQKHQERLLAGCPRRKIVDL